MAPEALLLLAVVLAPWWYGCAQDVARFMLASVLLGALCLGAWSSWPPPSLFWPSLGLVSVGLLQVACGLSAAPIHSLEGSMVLAAMLGTLLYWSDRGRDRNAARRLAVAVAATCAAQALFGVVQARLQPGLLYGTPPLAASPYGSFVSHNHFAGLLEMGLFMAAGLARGELGRNRRLTPRFLTLGGLCVVILGAHLASGSRGGLIAVLAGTTAFALAAHVARPFRIRRVRTLVVAATTVVMVAGLSIAVPEPTRQRLASVLGGPVDASGQYRLALASASIRLLASSPVAGTGIGTFSDAVTPFKRGHGSVRSTHAENDVLEHLAETGLVGMFLLAWLATVVIGSGVRRLRETRNPAREGLLIGAFGALGAIGSHSLFDFNLHIPSNALVAVSLAGIVSAPPSAQARSTPHRWLRGTASLVLLVLALAAGWRAWGAAQLAAVRSGGELPLRMAGLDTVVRWHPYLAEAYRARGLGWRELSRREGVFERTRLEKARRDLERALSLRPQWGEVWADLGWTQLLAGDQKAGEESLEMAARLDPTHVGIGVARAQSHFISGRVDAAISELARLQRLNPTWPRDAAIRLARQWTDSPGLLARLRD